MIIEPPEVLLKYSAISFLDFDKDGDVVKYIDIGRVDSKGITNSVKKLDILKFNVHINESDLERLKQHSKKLRRTVRKISYVYNFDKITFAKATNKKAPNLVEKIRVFGSDGYKESLLGMVDADVLPAFLGGNKTDPDGNRNCYTWVARGEDVPEENYMCKSERRLSLSPGVKKLTVPRFAKSDIRFEVSEPESLLEWEFETKSRDIGFGVYFKDSSSSEEEFKPIELVPKQRIDTCMVPEAGVYKCKKAGTYMIEFDNSYSWIYPKEIFYRARIIGPDDEENNCWK